MGLSVLSAVTRGLDPRVHQENLLDDGLPGSIDTKTRFALLPGNDEVT
jgi:hypothetical protein